MAGTKTLKSISVDLEVMTADRLKKVIFGLDKEMDDENVCAESTTFAGERQLFLPAKGQQRSVAHHLAALGCCRWPVGGREGQRRSADRRGGARSDPGNMNARRTRSVCRRPVHDVASAACRGAAFPRRLACSVRKLGTSNSSRTEWCTKRSMAAAVAI